jgi:predicted dehydrogenase
MICLKAKKNVLVEKPIGINSSEAKSMVNEAKYAKTDKLICWSRCNAPFTQHFDCGYL